MKICSVGAELFNAAERTDGRMDRQTDKQTDKQTDRETSRQTGGCNKPNIRFSQNCEKHLKLSTSNLMPCWIRVIRRFRSS